MSEKVRSERLPGGGGRKKDRQMAMNSSDDQSNRTYDIAHQLAQAAQRAPAGSATRRGLWNAFDKKHVAAEAMWFIEREQEKKNEGKGE